MINQNDKKFNCCESVVMKVQNEIALPGFCEGVMKVMSNMGGGVSGWGSFCGAVNGAAFVYGLLFGTEGNESLEDFIMKRKTMRDHTQKFIKTFEEKWGHVNCYDLLGVNTRTSEGRRKYNELRNQGKIRCEEYVSWSADKLIEYIKEMKNFHDARA